MSGTRMPATDAIVRSLNAVLQGETFGRSERLRSFLAYVVEKERAGMAHQLKGYSIGIDVFSRPHGFDAGSDPLVRVQAGKLRKLLDRYYEDEGRDAPLRITIPLGSYVPEYHWQAVPDDTALVEGTFQDDTPPRTRRLRSGWRPAPISSHLALLSLIPLAFLAPMTSQTAATIGLANARLIVAAAGDSSRADIAIPDLRIVHCWPGMNACRPLAEAIGKSAGYYDKTVHLRELGSASSQTPLSYTIRIEHKPGDLAVYARLIHDLTNETVHAAYFRRDDLNDETGILHEAVSFVSRTLGPDGRIYRHALRSGVASDMMKCLATSERRSGVRGALQDDTCLATPPVHTAGAGADSLDHQALIW